MKERITSNNKSKDHYALSKIRNVARKVGVVSVFGLALLGSSEKVSAETGGYPWSNAQEVYQPTFDWGYINCQPAMKIARTCDSHNKRKQGTNTYYHESDPWRYDVRNCTSYAAWRVNEEFGVNISKWGDASNWAIAAHRVGYQVSGFGAGKKGPEAGDLAQWDSNHVAFVESINPDGSVNVAEYNHDEHGNFDRRGEAYNGQKVVANHYIDINGVGNIWNGVSKNNTGDIPYFAIPENGLLTDGNWVYDKVGGSAWPIKPKSRWTSRDASYWRGNPAIVSTAEVHNHEVGYDQNGRNYGAHPPVDGTDVYVDGENGQQYYFLNGQAYPIGPGELDDLNVRNQAVRVPGTANRLSDFTQLHNFSMPNGSLYRFAGSPRVNLLSQHPNGSEDAYYVNNDTVLDCLQSTESQPVRILPQAARSFLHDSLGRLVPELSQPAACAFPPQMVLRGPGGVEQWRITGDNSSEHYTRHYYPSALLTYLHTSGRPDLHTMRSIAAINDVVQGSNMTPPEGQFFRDASSGQVFESTGGAYHPVLYPDTLKCLGNPSIIDVPGDVMRAMPQSNPVNCRFENRVVVRPDGRAYYIATGMLHAIGNPAVRDCIVGRNGTGAPISTSDSEINSYPNSGLPAHCSYEREPGLNFVREGSDPTIWLVRPDGTKQHVGSLCVSDPFTTVLKKFHVFTVPVGETAGHIQGPDWFASGSDCAFLPG